MVTRICKLEQRTTNNLFSATVTSLSMVTNLVVQIEQNVLGSTDTHRVSLSYVLTRLEIKQSGERSTESVVSDVEAPIYQVSSRLAWSIKLTAVIRAYLTPHKQSSTPSPRTILGSSDASNFQSLVLPITVFIDLQHLPLPLLSKQILHFGIDYKERTHYSSNISRCHNFSSSSYIDLITPGLNWAISKNTPTNYPRKATNSLTPS
jgi:hypothetical protein